MSTLTTGHLASNGGVRGHSAGSFFPYTVVAQGNPHIAGALTWGVQSPDGSITGKLTCEQAHELAQFKYDEDNAIDDGTGAT